MKIKRKAKNHKIVEAEYNEMLEEIGIDYSHKQLSPNQKKYEYILKHIPSNKKFEREVWCYSASDFYKLLAIWNSSEDYKVTTKTFGHLAKSNNINKKAAKYEVVDSEFNRKNYPNIIGQITDTPPSYANVKKIQDEKITMEDIYKFQNKMFTHPKAEHMPEDFVFKALKVGYDKNEIIDGLGQFYRQAPDAANSIFNKAIVKLKNPKNIENIEKSASNLPQYGDFVWESDSGSKWNISYKNIDPNDLYDEQGNSLTEKQIMKNMITGIQQITSSEPYSDKPLNSQQIEYWFEKFPEFDPDEFFENVQQTNNFIQDERRIEQRDIDMGW